MNLKKFLFDALVFLKNLRQSAYSPNKKASVIENVPYFNQRVTGALDKSEHIKWRENGCGMVCLKMILSKNKKRTYPLFELGRMCESYGGYVKNPQAPGDFDGLFFQPFLRFIKERFNLEGKIITPMTLKDIVKELEPNRFVIASVSSEIEDTESPPARKGGHLVLMLGYDWDKGVFFFNNTGYNKNQQMVQISFQKFEKFFAHRGVVIY